MTKKDHKSKACLIYRVSSGQPSNIVRPCLKIRNRVDRECSLPIVQEALVQSSAQRKKMYKEGWDGPTKWLPR